ncbi:MAG: hypothetical protein KAV87_54230 [Desulfobacteraceae bacterium]|nr:hypothetical protein [Desulfobacteraceae bacterium]
MNRLLKREIKLVPTEDLNIRYCRILERAELLDAEDIPVADAREVLWVEDELRRRTIKAVGHDFYPPDRIEKESPSNYMTTLLRRNKPKPELKPPNTKIKFKITVKSSIGSVVAEKNVLVDIRGEADLLANKLIRDLGLKKATYKLS